MATIISTGLPKAQTGAATPSSNASTFGDDKKEATAEVTEIPPLGVPLEEKRFFFQRARAYDPDAIATLPSVFDDPITAEKYKPHANWENNHRFNPLARWTWGEEHKLIRKVDYRIMIWACIMFIGLEIDRANINQALTDNFLKDLKMTTNDYNLGNSVFKLAFLCAELPSQLVSKWVGPDRWIPAQMVLWSIVAASQFKLSGRTSFLACRALLGLLQGGFIPDVILYLSYFYKHHELSIRLGFFWTALTIADIIAALLAAGLLKMRGIHGQAGWRWLFLIEAVITLVIGLWSFVLMPPGPCQTPSWFRGKKGWFNEREETILVNRVIREDPSKGTMHNRQPVTPRLLWRSMKDYDLWPLYLIGFSFMIPVTTPAQYLTLSLRGIGFDTFQTNLLVIPQQFLHIITLLFITYMAEVTGQLTLWSSLAQLWALPFIIVLRSTDINTINKWTQWGIMSLLLIYPYSHAIQVGWASRNSNTVRSRTVSAAMYNMFCQAGGIVASNIYRADDAPKYRRGNSVLIAITLFNVVLYGGTKYYYVRRNKQRDQIWNAMTDQQKSDYLSTTKDAGNKRLDFRFAH